MMNKSIFEVLKIKKPAGSDFANLSCVTYFATRMYEELEVYDRLGLHDWIDPREISVDCIRQLMDAEMCKADCNYVDVANYAMMLHFRGEEHFQGECTKLSPFNR